MERFIKARKGERFQQIVGPGIMRFLEFATLRLDKGERHTLNTGDHEYAVDYYSGIVTVGITTEGRSKVVYPHIGNRADVFDGLPVMTFVPPQAQIEIRAESWVEVGWFSSPSTSQTQPALLEGPTVVAMEVGQGNSRRTVFTALGMNVPAQRLLSGETVTQPGNWASYPPHKHDRSNPPHEVVLEEIYHFHVKPAQGFGFIWTYTAPDDPDGFSTVFVIEDGDTVLLPKGYHPVVAGAGYQLNYSWALAGEVRSYGPWSEDPRHALLENL